MGIRLLWKIYAGYAAVVILSVITLGGLAWRQVVEDATATIHHEIRSQAHLLRTVSESATTLPNPGLQQRLQSIGPAIGIRLTLIDKEGKVVSDSHFDPANLDNHKDRPEILAAHSHGQGRAQRLSAAMGEKMIYYALPVTREGKVTGYARTTIAQSAIDEQVAHLESSLALGALVSIVAALALGYALARHLAKPLETMTRTAESISSGDYAQSVAVSQNDEIGALARALNRMAGALNDRIDTLSEERNKLEAILAGMVEGVVAVDEEERVEHINAAAHQMLAPGQPFKGVGRPYWETPWLQPINAIIEEALISKVERREEIRIFGRGGDRLIEVLSVPTFAEGGAPAGALILLHDITELWRLERIRRDFVANVSHELKTPITSIRAMVETIIGDEEMTEEDRRRFLGKIEDQSIRLSTLVGDILALARIESSREPREKKRLDLAALAAEQARALEPEFGRRQVTLALDSAPESVYVIGDAETLAQAIGNLLDNALKYAASRVELSVSGDNGLAQLSVEDDGPGVDPGHHARIFERFYRVDTARSRQMGGTGLGLSIVKNAALVHGGDVTIKSSPGKGSRFMLTLPLASSIS